MPALESIAIKGFKSIRDIKVDLRDINVHDRRQRLRQVKLH